MKTRRPTERQFIAALRLAIAHQAARLPESEKAAHLERLIAGLRAGRAPSTTTKRAKKTAPR